jgi:hypothetical protein
VEFVRLSAELARDYMLIGRMGEALHLVDETLPTAERLELTRETLGLIATRGPVLANLGRLREGIVTLLGAMTASSSYGITDVELRARVNLSYAAAAEDPVLAYRVAREGVELARHLGVRGHSYYLLSNASDLATRIGDWDWVLPQVEEAATDENDRAAQLRLAQIRGLQGIDVQATLQALADWGATLTEVQAPATIDEARAVVALALGDFQTALELAQGAYRRNLSPDGTGPQTAGRAAAWLGDRDAAREAIALLETQPGRVPAASRREIEAALAVLEGRRGEARAGFADALRRWRDLGMEMEAAICALNFVNMLGPSHPDALAAADGAAALFERLGAKPFADLLARAMRSTPATPHTPVEASRAKEPTLQAPSD